MRCIHGGDSISCKKCRKNKKDNAEIVFKQSNPERIQKYNDGIYVRQKRTSI